MSMEKMEVVPRHCHSEDDGRCCDNNFDNTVRVDDRPGHSNYDLNVRKKMRSVNPPVAVSPLAAGDEDEIQRGDSPPRQWWFSRTTTNTAPTQQVNSCMVLTEHLGSTSDVVESLTHDVENWSLTRLSQTKASNKSHKKEKQRRSKEAQRQVRMARRQCLEAQQHQQRVVSSLEAMD